MVEATVALHYVFNSPIKSFKTKQKNGSAHRGNDWQSRFSMLYFPRKRRSREIQRQSIIRVSSWHLPDFQQDEKIEHLFYKRQARHISSYGIGWELEGIENGFRLTEGIAFLLSRGKDKGLGSDDIAAHLVETSETDIRSAHSLAVADFP